MLKTEQQIKTSEYNKAYYLKNKQKWKEYGKVKFFCKICNCDIVNIRKQRHRKSKKHCNTLKLLNSFINVSEINKLLNLEF